MDEEIFKQEDDLGTDYIRIMRLKKHGYDWQSIDLKNAKIQDLLSDPEVDLKSDHIRDILLGRVELPVNDNEAQVINRGKPTHKKKASSGLVSDKPDRLSVRIVRIRFSENDYKLLRLISSFRVQSYGKILSQALKETLSNDEKDMLSVIGLVDNMK